MSPKAGRDIATYLSFQMESSQSPSPSGFQPSRRSTASLASFPAVWSYQNLQANDSGHSFFFSRNVVSYMSCCQDPSPSILGMNDFSTSKTIAQPATAPRSGLPDTTMVAKA